MEFCESAGVRGQSGGRLKILFLQKRLLFPANTGGKIRTLNVLRHLAHWHEVTYVCGVLPEELPHLQRMRQLRMRLFTTPWTEAPRPSVRFFAGLGANLFSRYPYSVSKDYDARLRAEADRLLRSERFDLLICDFVQMALNVPPECDVPKLLFQHNVEAEIYQRLADRERGRLKRWFIRTQQHKMERFEREAGRRFDRVVAVSERDRQHFTARYGWQHVDIIDTAVDTDFYRPLSVDRIPGRLVFLGSMDWLPNQTGVCRFVGAILPLIRLHHPEVSLDIVGRNPTAAIRRLALHAGVTVTGTVEDVRPYIARAEVGIVPLYAGGGTRLKIFELMAMGTPVVSTSLGAEGLDIDDGAHWLCADTDAEFAAAIVRLLNEPMLRSSLSHSALSRVREHYSSESVARQFERACYAALR